MRLQPIKNSLRERRQNRKRNKNRRIAKNQIKYLPKDGHGRMVEFYSQLAE